MSGTVAKFELNDEQIKQLQEALKNYNDGCGHVFHEYLLNQGSDIIEDNIQDLIHPSGRKWKGKPAASKSASKTRVFQVENGSVTTEIVIKLKKSYVYLVFPDHKQGFLQDAVDKSTNRIMGELLDLLERKDK